VWFYRQSDIPEIPELTWFLSCVAGKGILNRAHAYKAAVDRTAPRRWTTTRRSPPASSCTRC
jgi:tryptophanyl-tRNA synthetase